MEDINNIKSYLEDAKAMETAVFTQKSIIDRLQDKINALDFTERKFTEPCKPVQQLPINSLGTIFKILSIGILVPGLLYGLWFFHFITIPGLATDAEFTVSTAIAIIAAFMITYAMIRKATVNSYNSHTKALKEYVRLMRKYEEDLVSEEKRLEYLERKKKYLLDQQKEMVRSYKEIKESLKQYYSSSDIIKPEFQNMVAVNQILQYIDSEKCVTLTGTGGAYKLFENGLKSNKITGNMDVILSSPDKIKTEQNMLYIEIEKAEYIGDKVLKSTVDAASSLDSEPLYSALAEYNSHIKALNSQITTC